MCNSCLPPLPAPPMLLLSQHRQLVHLLAPLLTSDVGPVHLASSSTSVAKRARRRRRRRRKLLYLYFYFSIYLFIYLFIFISLLLCL